MTERDPPRTPAPTPRASLPAREDEELVLAELVSRILDRGVVVAGEVTLSVAGIDLVYLGLRLELSSIETRRRREGAQVAEGHAAGDLPDGGGSDP